MKDYKRFSKYLSKYLGESAWLAALTIIFYVGAIAIDSRTETLAQQTTTQNIASESDREACQPCQSLTVRIIKADSAGSGVITSRQGNLYSVMTNWHVVDSSNPMILTADDRQHQLTKAPQQLGEADLALLQFYSEEDYPIAKIRVEAPQVGDRVYAAGFPLTDLKPEKQSNSQPNNHSPRFDNQAFRLTEGEVLIIPGKSLAQGYQLGYTNDTVTGMSGSPIFDQQGRLVAIHGRGKYRDPNFGVYIFVDGSEPNPKQLKRMVQSSWGIPLGTFLELSY